MPDTMPELFAHSLDSVSSFPRVDGSVVKIWALHAEAKQAARQIGWPMSSVKHVCTRFCAAWALAGGPGQGYLTRDGYEVLKAVRT